MENKKKAIIIILRRTIKNRRRQKIKIVLTTIRINPIANKKSILKNKLKIMKCNSPKNNLKIIKKIMIFRKKFPQELKM